MDNWLTRTELLIGKTSLDILKQSTVAIFGVGGVGSFASEALVRTGIGNIILIDHDIIDITNINRQLMADTSVIGDHKVNVAYRRFKKINPNINIHCIKTFLDEQDINEIIPDKIDYIADCIDSVDSKLSLIEFAQYKHIPIISSMGAGNKLDPTKFKISNIYDTSVCPLAKTIRKKAKEKNLAPFKVVYSTEQPKLMTSNVIGSISFVPSVAGLILASEIVKDLIKNLA